MGSIDSYLDVLDNSKDGIWIHGLVKSETGADHIELSRTQSPCNWIRIPRSAIVHAIIHGSGSCIDQQSGEYTLGIVSTLLLSQPKDPVAAAFAGLLRDMQSATDKCSCHPRESSLRSPEKWYLHKSKVQANTYVCSQEFNYGTNWERQAGFYNTSRDCNDAIPHSSREQDAAFSQPGVGHPAVQGMIYVTIEVRCPKCDCFLASFSEYRESSSAIFLGAIVTCSYTGSCYNKGFCGSGAFDWSGTATSGRVISIG